MVMVSTDTNRSIIDFGKGAEEFEYNQALMDWFVLWCG